jgi:diacylglycerol kinase (ATP)
VNTGALNQLPVGVVINPTSGKGKGAKVAPEVWQALAGVRTLDLSAESFEQALANAREAIERKAIRALLVVGGDGIVHLGVNACAKTPVPLGIIAAGTGNDCATALGLPVNDIPAAVRVALEHIDDAKPVDLISGVAGKPDGKKSPAFFSLGTVSAGFDAIVNARANRMSWPKGPIRYQLAMVLELMRFRGIEYRMVANGTERRLDAMLCAVANAPAFGGGMLIAPHAKLDDGQLDLFIVHRIPRRTLLRIFPKVFTGGHVGHPAVEFVPLAEVELDSGGLPLYADGEFVGYSPLKANLAAGALLVCAPR